MLILRKWVLVGTIAAAFTLGLAVATALQEGEGPEKGDGAGAGDSSGPRIPAPLVDTELSKLVGRWDWEGKIFNSQTKKWGPLESRDEWRWGLNGQFLFMDFEAPDAFGHGEPMKGLWIVRPKGEGKYKAWWFDVFGNVEASEGELKDGTFTFIGKSDWGVGRSIFSIGEDGTYESSSAMKGPDGEWMPHLEGKARKVR